MMDSTARGKGRHIQRSHEHPDDHGRNQRNERNARRDMQVVMAPPITLSSGVTLGIGLGRGWLIDGKFLADADTDFRHG
jgi:hypothetical protein